MTQPKHVQLEKFGIMLKSRRKALDLTMREVAELSGLSPALIAKLENGTMPNFPKPLTIKQLSNALKLDDELFVMADILDHYIEKESPKKTFEQELRELLATRTRLNPENIEQTLWFISGLEKVQKINEIQCV